MEVVPSSGQIIYDQYSGSHFEPTQVGETIDAMLNDLAIAHLDLSNTFKQAIEKNIGIYQCLFCHLNKDGHTLVSTSVAPVLHRWYVSGQ